MHRITGFIFAAFVVFGLLGCETVAPEAEAEILITKARFTVEMFKLRQEEPSEEFRRQLRVAHGVVVFPKSLKGSFIVGAEGGNGVLLARDETGNWGYPAFYTMGAGSLGLQIGAQASEIVLLLRSKDAVTAVVHNQGKLGGDIQMTMGNVGAGMEAATTTNGGADIVGFSHAEGIFAGVSVEGAVLARRNDINAVYYGDPGATAEAIVMESRFSNPQADSLRDALVIN